MELASSVSRSCSADVLRGFCSSSGSVCCSRSGLGNGMAESLGMHFPARRERSVNIGSRIARHVVCMAHPRRVKMVGQQIRREVAEMLLTDKVLQQAVLPEAGLGADMYLSSVATVSDVVMSRDLQVAKVYISVFGDERGADIAMEGLQAKAKYVRMGLGKRMQLRMTPEVRFIRDDAMEKGSRVLDILEKLKEERERKERGEDLDEDEDNWDDEDDREEVQEELPKKQAKASQKKDDVARKIKADDNKEKKWPTDIKWPESSDVDDISEFGSDEKIIFIK
eukprot:TRINITY_DN725_c0_g2_i2.p2 TRINITY_DN725_c0_g2~~TRINITY_DN725_c0_g2_i2.p2  ORF type:complete len:281 (+),score=57.35 TRINITY_DN725_c0_g2_i2:114-956(+)